MKKNISVLIFLILTLIISSCSITKRRYRKGVYIQHNEQVNTKSNPSEKEKKDSVRIANIFHKSGIKSDYSKITYSVGLGVARPLSMPFSFDVSYKGFGLYSDYFLLSVTKYTSSGGYYDILRKNSNNSLKLGVSYHFNFRTTYEYLFKYKNSNMYVGYSMFFVGPDYLKSLKAGGFMDMQSIPDAKYLTKGGWFISSAIYVGIKFQRN